MSTTTTNLSSFLPAVPTGALLYQRATTNSIGATVANATNLGYLAAGKSQLEVVSQITGQDPTAVYNFTLQTGNALNFKVTNIANANGTSYPDAHIQVYDGSGTRVIADNQGTAAQQQAYAQLTSTTGLSAKPGTYVIKVGYGTGANKQQTQNYAIQIDSGTGNFVNDYRTLASPSTVNLTLLQGGSLGYSASVSAAIGLITAQSGSTLNIFDALDSNANNATNSILA